MYTTAKYWEPLFRCLRNFKVLAKHAKLTDTTMGNTECEIFRVIFLKSSSKIGFRQEDSLSYSLFSMDSKISEVKQ